MKNIDVKRLYKAIAYNLDIAYRPLRINIELTDFCNLRCPTCSKWKEIMKQRDMKKEQWQEVLNKVKGFSLSRILTISGGEPFSRKDIFDILGYAQDFNYQPIIISNGTLLNSKKIDTLKNYSVRQITLSVNGIRSQTHDPTRGVIGSLEKTMACLDLLLESDIPVAIQTILLKTNLDEIIDLVHLAQNKKLKGISFQVLTAENVHNLFLDDRSRIPEEGWYEKDPLWITDTKKFSDVVNKLLCMKKNGSPIINSFEQLKYFPTYYKNHHEITKIPCMTGITNFTIDPYGNVRLCYSFEPIGNILEQSPKEIWRSSRARKVQEKIRNCQATCRMINSSW
jgi:MoaA/NifB/PqqE/SkfB family radical SAM enzyme